MSRTFRTALILSFLLVPVSSFAAAPPLAFAKHFGSAGNTAVAEAVAIDFAGEVCIAGTFTGSINFGGPSWSYTSFGGADLFIAEYNSAGVIQWAQRFGSAANEALGDMVMDNNGNIIITGSFTSTVNFGGGNTIPTGTSDIFLCKYQLATGTGLWATHFGVAGSICSGEGLATDGAGNIALVGNFQGSANLGGGVLVSSGGEDGFLAKYDQFGNHQWSRKYGSISLDGARAVAFDPSGGVVVGGVFSAPMLVDGHPLSNTFQDIFMAKYSGAGVLSWVKSFTGSTSESIGSMAIDSAHNIYFDGYFRDSISLGGATLLSAGPQDIFLAKLGSTGNHKWSARYGGADDDLSAGIVVGPNASIVLSANFTGNVDFGGGIVDGDESNYDAIVVDYDSTGAYQWQRPYIAFFNQSVTDVATDGANGVAVCGAFQSSVDFGGGPKLTAMGTQDAFVAYYHTPASGVGDTPVSARLSLAAYPNPFNPQTTLSYTLPEREHISVAIFDVKGNRVARLIDDEESSGAHTITWNGTNDRGTAVGSGVYFARLTTPHETRDVKLMLLK